MAVTVCTITGGGSSISFGNGSGQITPMSITPSWNALDSSKTGRDNSTGDMFRDKITDKMKWTIELPYGLDQSQVASILSIIKTAQYSLTIPDPLTGTNISHNVYTTSCEPKIAKMTSASSWIYESFSFNAIQF